MTEGRRDAQSTSETVKSSYVQINGQVKQKKKNTSVTTK